MTHLIVKKSDTLNGKLKVPSSKSQSIRGLFLALLSQGESTLNNILDSEDTEDAIRACKALGAKISIHEDTLIFKSNGLPLSTQSTEINTGNSGITTRFVMPLLGLRDNTDQPIILDCGKQMRARPIQSLVNSLRSLGLCIEYLNIEGQLPVRISGKLLGGISEIDGISSQYLSALLIALPFAENESEIMVKNLQARPYINLTLNWLDKQNISYIHQQLNECEFYKIKGRQKYKNFHATISGDFSSASYLIAAAVLTEGHVELTGLDMKDSQGDKRLIQILLEMGAKIETKTKSLIIQGGKTLNGLRIDANDIPDLLPTLAVIGTYAKGKTEIINVKQARLKETDRIHSMTEGLSRLGAHVDEHEDGMTIYESSLKGTEVKGYSDHRTVMALAIAGLVAKGTTIIDDADAIHKTFPKFVDYMNSIGAHMESLRA